MISFKSHQKPNKNQTGFTMLELVVVIVIIGILTALFVSTYAGIQRNDRNQTRRSNVQEIYQQLEAYYVEDSKYPTLNDMNSSSWVQTNMKTLDSSSLQDPSGVSKNLVARPQPDAYAYQVSSASGAGCNDTTTPCAHYTLTATLEDSAEKTFVKSSLN
jgi:prepilin-type N-terminal cleavage/methylation domain-containing protein